MKPTMVTETAGEELQTLTTVRKILLICGILSSLLYVGVVLLLGMQFEGYSWAAQNVSELNAIGSPTRPLFISLMGVYTVLVIAFGVGVWATDGRSRSLRIAGVMLVAYALAGYATGLFFPMPMREAIVAGAEGNAAHPIVTAVMGLFFVLSIGFAAAAHGKVFRLYSMATILLIVATGVWVGMDVPRMEAQLPTPWMGLKERINILAIMQWVPVLAVILMRAKKRPNSTCRNGA